MKTTIAIITLLAICTINAVAQGNVTPDTTLLQEVEVSAIKQVGSLRQPNAAYTLITGEEARKLAIYSLKGMTDVVPNFFVPDYGSRITSSIYVRGLGARMDQPAVGMIVDNIPILNKDAFDFDIIDITRMEMLRGPQAALYGRNTMCGLINISTLSPMQYQGVRLMAEYGTHNTARISAGYFARPNKNLAWSLTGAYHGTDGCFRNKYNNHRVGRERQWSGRQKTEWRPSTNMILTNVLTASHLNQSGYPYLYVPTGDINYNDTCFYRRLTLMDGLTITALLPTLAISSITTFQYINDNMTLDQDFLPQNYFTLTQKKKEWALTEDIVVKSRKKRPYAWLSGLFVFYRHNDMHAPVTFGDVGIKELIEQHRNDANPDYPIRWDTRSFILNSDFTIPTYGVAVYHQSEYTTGRFTLTAALRFDYEHATLHYHSHCNTGYTIMQLHPDGEVPYRHENLNIDERGILHKDFAELLPRLAVTYTYNDTPGNDIYISIAKGYKAGGFNTQMFSDVLQQKLMNKMGIGSVYNVNDIIGYKPEKSWNFEVGTHMRFLDGRLRTEATFFYIDCTDQQLTMFPDGTTTGRIMTNAGHTRSYGVELSAEASPWRTLYLRAAYGYTDARFIKFNNGINNFAHKHIPYAPSNTLFVQTEYTIHTPFKAILDIVIEAHATAAGKIYWNEQNTLAQPFYAQLGASLTLKFPQELTLTLRADNITDTQYNTFYFVSMSNEFLQRGRPRQLSATLTWQI